MQYKILNQIQSPDDIKALNDQQIEQLLPEIRDFLIQHVTQTGGHLASNLGVVELSVALHRVFSTPHDRIFWDVGHQSYVHKILTGRAQEFATLRQNGGLSGFPKPSESIHDPFISGHSSTSVSVASGFAEADRIFGKDVFNIAVVGDGAYTGGLIHEALNNVRTGEHLIIILNENEMSISPNTGKFATYLAKLRSSNRYFRLKRTIRIALGKLPLVGKHLVRRLTHVKQSVKSIIYRSNYIEDLGFQYLGPIDGNDYKRLENLLLQAKQLHDNVVVHIKTCKGLGYPPAQKDPNRFHSVAPNTNTASQIAKEESFSQICGQTLLQAMENDPHLVAITAAMADGTGLSSISEHFPERFFDVGIAEEHAVTFAAGLAANGAHPVFAVYSTFLQRAYDNLLHDIAITSQPLTLCIDRAGFNDADGITHHGIFDVAFLSHVHGISLYAPVRASSLQHLLLHCFACKAPSAVRYARGGEHTDMLYGLTDLPQLHLLCNVSPADDVVFITYGNETQQVRIAQKMLAQQGVRAGVIVTEQLLPIQSVAAALQIALQDVSSKALLVFAEEGIRQGGFGMLMQSELLRVESVFSKKMLLLGIEDPTLSAKTGCTMYETAGIDSSALTKAVLQTIS